MQQSNTYTGYQATLNFSKTRKTSDKKQFINTEHDIMYKRSINERVLGCRSGFVCK